MRPELQSKMPESRSHGWTLAATGPLDVKASTWKQEPSLAV